MFCFTELKQQFESFIDKDRDGKATVDEVRKYLEQYNDDVTEDQAQSFLDRRNNNRITAGAWPQQGIFTLDGQIFVHLGFLECPCCRESNILSWLCFVYELNILD